jgi:hypothetical protein
MDIWMPRLVQHVAEPRAGFDSVAIRIEDEDAVVMASPTSPTGPRSFAIFVAFDCAKPLESQGRDADKRLYNSADRLTVLRSKINARMEEHRAWVVGCGKPTRS